MQIFWEMATPEAFLSVTDANSLESDLCFETVERWLSVFNVLHSQVAKSIHIPKKEAL